MTDSSTRQEQSDSVSGCLVRFLWTTAGNLALFFLAVSIAQHKAMKLSIRDGTYWAMVVVLIVVRFVDIRFLHGGTAEGDPATLSHWRRYVALLVGAALALWLVAHGLAASGWLR